METRQAGITAIYQELSLFPDLNVAENIFVGCQPVPAAGGSTGASCTSQAEELLTSLGVHLDLKQKARSLSIAQQQMVEIARAFSINARILIMDEPTSSLTLNEVADLFRLVRRLREEGTAIIFISHRLEELFEIADRVTVLRDGTYVDTRSDERCDPRRSDPHDGRTHHYEPVPEAGCASRGGRAESREPDPWRVHFEMSVLSCAEGEILGMAGLVGAGRTNVARAIFGVEPATSGSIQLDGKM